MIHQCFTCYLKFLNLLIVWFWMKTFLMSSISFHENHFINFLSQESNKIYWNIKFCWCKAFLLMGKDFTLLFFQSKNSFLKLLIALTYVCAYVCVAIYVQVWKCVYKVSLHMYTIYNQVYANVHILVYISSCIHWYTCG